MFLLLASLAAADSITLDTGATIEGDLARYEYGGDCQLSVTEGELSGVILIVPCHRVQSFVRTSVRAPTPIGLDAELARGAVAEEAAPVGALEGPAALTAGPAGIEEVPLAPRDEGGAFYEPAAPVDDDRAFAEPPAEPAEPAEPTEPAPFYDEPLFPADPTEPIVPTPPPAPSASYTPPSDGPRLAPRMDDGDPRADAPAATSTRSVRF